MHIVIAERIGRSVEDGVVVAPDRTWRRSGLGEDGDQGRVGDVFDRRQADDVHGMVFALDAGNALGTVGVQGKGALAFRGDDGNCAVLKRNHRMHTCAA